MTYRSPFAVLALAAAVAASCPPTPAPAADAAAPYAERYRPLYHFTPPKNFMNDPNGLVVADGRYHLFYQHNPFGDTWGHMSWGHAVSPDLVRWTHKPVALAEEGDVMVWSGSAVIDRDNTSGLCTPGKTGGCLVAVYTSRIPAEQTQSLAVSNDGGETWAKYAGNPVLDINVKDFRDPKVFWHEPTRRWVMVVVKATEYKVAIYGSPDLKTWTHLSDFGPAGVRNVTWECPDLFELPVQGRPGETRWVMKVDFNPGSVQGGSGGQYFLGTFDGTIFTNENPPTKVNWVDYGKDFYASQSWSDVPASDGRRIWIGWLSNWQYTSVAPTSPWRGAQSVPRTVTLRDIPGQGIRLVQEPVAELASLREGHVRLEGMDLDAANRALAERGVRGTALEIDAVLEPGTSTEVGLSVRRGAEGEETLVGYDAPRALLSVDRTASGDVAFHPGFPGEHAAPLPMTDGRVRLRILVDASSVEVFGGAGETVITDAIFPAPESDGVQLYAKNGTARVVSMDVWRMRSAWAD